MVTTSMSAMTKLPDGLGWMTDEDLFDRILLAQAKSEGMKFMTHDSLIPYYNESFVISV